METSESYNVAGERNIHDKVTSLKNLAKSYEMKMRGFGVDTTNEAWKPMGKALSGKEFITQSSGIIYSFAEPSNLMTGKSPEKFMMEFADAFYRVNTMILNDQSTPASNYRAVIKMFKDTLSNVGDIITVSKNYLQKIFDQFKLEAPGAYE